MKIITDQTLISEGTFAKSFHLIMTTVVTKDWGTWQPKQSKTVLGKEQLFKQKLNTDLNRGCGKC